MIAQFRYPLYAIGIATIIVIGTAQGALATAAVMVWLGVFSLAVLVALMQLAFYGYHAVRDGDPFYAEHVQRAGATRIVYRDAVKKPKTKWCDVCKRNTTCRSSRTDAGFWIHVAGK